MEPIKKIDIHAHVSPFAHISPENPFEKKTFPGSDELISMYDSLGIEYGVLHPLVSPEGLYFTMTNEAIKMEADRYPDRFFWFCNVDPRSMTNSASSDLSYLLEHYVKLGARGFGELTSNLYIDDPKMDNLFSHCEEMGLPVLFHISPGPGINYGMIDERGLPRLEQALKKHPRLTFIGHSQPFRAEMSPDYPDEKRNDYPTGKVTSDGAIVRLLRSYDNLYCDISGNSGRNALMRDPDYAASFLNEFQDRILYGCDICAVTNRHPYLLRDFLDELCMSGAIPETAYRKIGRENAVRILKL